MDYDDPKFNGRFDLVGHCIYCLADSVPLSREHIVPYALNGELVLPKAESARPCHRITGYELERNVLEEHLPQHKGQDWHEDAQSQKPSSALHGRNRVPRR